MSGVCLSKLINLLLIISEILIPIKALLSVDMQIYNKKTFVIMKYPIPFLWKQKLCTETVNEMPTVI